jgi:YD repeat-containing protein
MYNNVERDAAEYLRQEADKGTSASIETLSHYLWNSVTSLPDDSNNGSLPDLEVALNEANESKRERYELRGRRKPAERVQLLPDDARVVFDGVTGNPLAVVDAAGNSYSYGRDDDGNLTSVRIQGPRTNNQLIEYRRNSLMDYVVNGAPGVILGPLAARPLTHYTTFVDGREMPAIVAAGGGRVLQGTAGIALPFQTGINASVDRNTGALTLQYPIDTIDGAVSNRQLRVTYNPDGTTVLVQETGFLFRDRTTTVLDRDGRPRR